MCGICGFIGFFDGFNYGFDGIQMLLNRGFDSLGVCTINNNEFIARKFISNDGNVEDMVNNLKNVTGTFTDASNIIFHSRWRVCGAKTEINCHPHIDYTNRFSIVHNGIIENYMEIKNKLEAQGIPFRSQTDTEVIVNLISILYDKYNDIEKAMEETFNQLEGTWGIVLLAKEFPNKMFCARHGSPLLIGYGDNYMMVASEQSGFYKYVNNYICLNDHDIVVLEKKDNKIIFHKKNNYTIRKITSDLGNKTPDPYPHWTIKEIYEQYDASLRAMGMGSRISNDKEVKLGGLDDHIDDLKRINNLILLGCGTSYHAGLYTSNTFKEISGFGTVQIFDGAEFTKYDIPKSGKTALIFISQSGETKDLYRCIEIGRDNNLLMIGVVNVVDSLIAREVTCGVYLNAGREVAVASTKAFTTQVIVLSLIAVWFAQIRNINDNKRETIIKWLRRLPLDIKTTIDNCIETTKEVAKKLVNNNSLFIIGKGKCDPIGKEGALKIKEIGYVHAESYSSSALKHGPLSLLGKNTPVIMIVPNDEHYGKNIGVADEIKSRDSQIFGISDTDMTNIFNINIRIPKNDYYSSLLANIPLQLIAYELAVLKGTNPDKPSNLAKVVTV
jgi:glucosamine--fructose-6-phosphate aminotransferase (isomerizing)